MFEWIKEILDKFWHYIFPFFVIDEFERGVLLRFGKNPKEFPPGIHFKIPFVDSVLTCIVVEETAVSYNIHVTTLDNETIAAGPTFRYIIEDPIKWLIETNDAKTNVNDIVRLVASDYLSDITWDECKQKTTWTQIKNKINAKIKSTGAKVTDFGLADICKIKVILTKI